MKSKLNRLFGFILIPLAFMASASFANAQLPTGLYTGFVSNNAFNEWCQLNRATMDFTENKDGSVFVRWSEEGFAPYGGGFCENFYDATFTPTDRKNVWDVDFLGNFDLVFGRATLRDNGLLEIEASYTGMRTGFQWFRTRLIIKPENKSISYERRIERFGPTLFATGVLYQ